MAIKITNEGNELLTNAVLNGEKVNFGRVELVADAQKSPSDLSVRVNVGSVSQQDDKTIVIKAMVGNEGFRETYYFNRVNIYANEVLFAYDEECNICIPPESIKTINALDMYLKIESKNSELKIMYEGYVLQKDFDELKNKISTLTDDVGKLKKESMTDISRQVDWNNQCEVMETYKMGNLVIFCATYKTETGYSESIAQIPDKYCPSNNVVLNTVVGAHSDTDKYVNAILNCLNGNIDVEVSEKGSGSNTGLITPVTVVGFWRIKE